MKKLLYIAPHLSTGGLPQYLTKKVELLRNDFEIFLVEWVDCTGGRLVVQRNQLQEYLDNNHFFTLQENKMELIDIIDRVKPDIVHSEEIPEFYMDFDVASKLYRTDRDYIIVETSHDSSYDTTQKKFFPDKFLFVSEWQVQQYKDIEIPKKVVYYPIEYKERPNRDEALRALGLDPNKKHVLHVGLFTPRKNQAEFFEYARSLPEYEFHSVGNQADNFKWYAEPLMANKPDNVTWWNERKDVDNFYKAMDLFLFTSRGHDRDKETMPLVIREAISWNMELLIYNLPVYLDYFDAFDNVNYLEFDAFETNCEIIKDTLEKSEEINPLEEAYIVGTYPNTPHLEKITIDCLKALKKDNRIIITTSHCPVSKEIQELSDYVIYDKNNVTSFHTFNWYFHNTQPGWKVFGTPIQNGKPNFYHGPACHTNNYNAMALAHSLGIKKAYIINYDDHLKNIEAINDISKILNKHTLYTEKILDGGGDVPQLRTAFMAIRPKTFIESLPKISTKEEWDSLQEKTGAPSNGMEAIWYQFLKNDSRAYWESNEKFTKTWDNAFTHLNFSQAEGFTVLPVKDSNDAFVIYLLFNNGVDSRKAIITYTSEENEELWSQTLEITSKFAFWKLINYSLDTPFKTKVTLETRDLETDEFISKKEIEINNDFITNVLPNNGYFEFT